MPSSTTASLLHAVRSHGIFGLARWRDECLRTRVAPEAVQAALQAGATALRLTAPIGTVFPSPEPGLRQASWQRNAYTHRMAAETLWVVEAIEAILRQPAQRTPIEQTTAALHEAILTFSDGELQLGRPLHLIVREWPCFDPVAGYADLPLERALTHAWIARTPSALTEDDKLTLRMALGSHALNPSSDLSHHVLAARPAARVLGTGDVERVEAAVASAPAAAVQAPVQTPPALGM
jgi:hypothetical protein